MSVAGSVLGRIYSALVDGLPLALVEHAEKTRLVALVAGGGVTALFDGDHDRVGVAVDAYLVDDLKVSRFLALAPEFISRAREVAGTSGGDGFLERFAIHPGDHQHAAGFVIDGDRRDHAATFVEIDCRR